MNGRFSPSQERWSRLIADLVASPLRLRGYRKRRFVWARQTGKVWPIVDVQRGHSDTRDFVSFTLNWGLFVSDFMASAFVEPPLNPKTYTSPVSGRIGAFSEDPRLREAWWAIEDGMLRGRFPDRTGPELHFEHEIRHQVALMLDFLDAHASLEAVLDLADRVCAGDGDVPGHPHVAALADDSMGRRVPTILSSLLAG